MKRSLIFVTLFALVCSVGLAQQWIVMSNPNNNAPDPATTNLYATGGSITLSFLTEWYSGERGLVIYLHPVQPVCNTAPIMPCPPLRFSGLRDLKAYIGGDVNRSLPVTPGIDRYDILISPRTQFRAQEFITIIGPVIDFYGFSTQSAAGLKFQGVLSAGFPDGSRSEFVGFSRDTVDVLKLDVVKPIRHAATEDLRIVR